MKRFVTDYQINGVRYSGEVDALDFEHAQQICDQRGRGETVAGVLYVKIAASRSFDREKANAMLKRFAETDDGEAPDASDFEE